MNDQTFILLLLVLTVIAAMWLYLLKAKKQIIYKGDERWQTVQLKADQIANIADWILIVFIFGGTASFCDGAADQSIKERKER